MGQSPFLYWNGPLVPFVSAWFYWEEETDWPYVLLAPGLASCPQIPSLYHDFIEHRWPNNLISIVDIGFDILSTPFSLFTTWINWPLLCALICFDENESLFEFYVIYVQRSNKTCWYLFLWVIKRGNRSYFNFLTYLFYQYNDWWWPV